METTQTLATTPANKDATAEKGAFCKTLREGLEAGLATAHECKLNANYHIRALRQAIVALSVFEQQIPAVNQP